MDDRNDLYDTVIKAAGVCLAIALWYISMRFSVDGFEIATEEDAWIGWTLGALVTYLQVLFNRGSKNETMYWAGIIAYVYGLATNLMGIMAVRGEAFTLSMFGDNFFGALLQITVVFAIAAAVEILPEHLFINALRPDGQDGDFITSLKKGLDGIRTPSRGNRSGGVVVVTRIAEVVAIKVVTLVVALVVILVKTEAGTTPVFAQIANTFLLVAVLHTTLIRETCNEDNYASCRLVRCCGQIARGG